jgi:ubiquinone/menaquinone biosynthesis C-methylase UbiE
MIVTPKINRDALSQAYDAWHGQMASSGVGANPLELPWYRSAYSHIKIHAYGDVLEIGCGRGEFAIWLSRQLPTLNITAVDFSSEAIDIATREASAKGAILVLKQANAEALPFPEGSFDYVISCECIEHVTHPSLMAQEIYRVLRPGGSFCLTTENYLNGMLIAWIRCWITGAPFNSGSGVQPRENFFFFWHIIAHLKNAGLNIDKTESCHYQWLLLPRVDPARLCTPQFSKKFLRYLAKPFGRHFSFFGRKTDRNS